ncbi:ribulokinase, partial [Rhizobium johnstonii]
ELSKRAVVPLPVLLADMAARKAGRFSDAVTLASGVHVVPEFLGNRAPFADLLAKSLELVLGAVDEHDR